MIGDQHVGICTASQGLFLCLQIVDIELPAIKRPQKATEQEKKEFSALFDSDSDDNDTDLTERLVF